MSASLNELRRAFETATANIDKVSFTITAVPASPDDLMAMLTVARAAGHDSGAALRRIELPTLTAESFGRTFHDVAVSDAEGPTYCDSFSRATRQSSMPPLEQPAARRCQ